MFRKTNHRVRGRIRCSSYHCWCYRLRTLALLKVVAPTYLGRADDCELRSKRVRFVGGAELTSIFGEFVLSALTPGGKGPVAGADLFPKNAVNFDLRDI